MSALMLRRIPGGFVPATDEDAESCRRFRIGEIYPGDIKDPRNGPFFRKWWALVKTVYEIWKDRMPEKEINGIKVGTSFERFRKDITIMAGYYEAVYNAQGEVRLEAQSLAWASMSEATFHKLYSDTIDAALHKILPGCGFTRDDLEKWSLRVLEFSR